MRMLDRAINRHVLPNFSVRQASELKLDLDGLFYPDFGLAAAKQQKGARTPIQNESVAVKLQKLRAHAAHAPSESDPLFSIILYGPPGTGKTTLVEAVAKSANVPLVEITPSDILVGGAEGVERRARHVFLALSMLTHVVILFDEFDSILQDRAETGTNRGPSSVFEFLTPGMLPKLKRLHDAAKIQRVSYVLATNFVYRLDAAITRQGRFDDKHGIYPPDVVSRLGRLCNQLKGYEEQPSDEFWFRVGKVVQDTKGGAMDQIGRPGWYTTPGDMVLENTLFHFILHPGAKMPNVRPEAIYHVEKRKEDDRPSGRGNKNVPTKKGILEAAKENKENKEDREPRVMDALYWTEWETIVEWDEAFSQSRSHSDWSDQLEGLVEKERSYSKELDDARSQRER
jgi:hypothetical protein